MSVSIVNLKLARGSFALDLSLELAQGETGVILGPSGCGKTTLLRIIAGLEGQDSGRVLLSGTPIDALPPERRDIGFVFQDLALFDHLSGRRNIGYALSIRGKDRAAIRERVEELARSMRIERLLDRMPPSMSGGERQRLAFARALAREPSLLLMDEPLSALDASLRRELRAYLRALLRDRGITALHVTHDVEEALELADRLFIMRAGKIIASGSPEALFAAPPDAWTAAFLGTGPVIRLDENRFINISRDCSGCMVNDTIPGSIRLYLRCRRLLFLGDGRHRLVATCAAAPEGATSFDPDAEMSFDVGAGDLPGLPDPIDGARLTITVPPERFRILPGPGPEPAA